MFSFDLLANGGAARAGTFTTPHGDVPTPAFMPVGTLGTVKGLSMEEVEGLGARMVLGNTYHLYLRPGHELVRQLGGLHDFMRWDGPILTDSGGYQVFSLAKLRKITEAGVQFQNHINGAATFIGPEEPLQIQAALGYGDPPADQAWGAAIDGDLLQWHRGRLVRARGSRWLTRNGDVTPAGIAA